MLFKNIALVMEDHDQCRCIKMVRWVRFKIPVIFAALQDRIEDGSWQII